MLRLASSVNCHWRHEGGRGMTGERDLARLLAGMRPMLDQRPYGFAIAERVPTGLTPFATVAEDEGLTLIAPVADLRRVGLDPGSAFARITLTVHSDLQAVGLTAAFAAALADRGISANVIAGFCHDHIFLPWDRRDDAMSALRALSAASSDGQSNGQGAGQGTAP